jgi:hypothetical protein
MTDLDRSEPWTPRHTQTVAVGYVLAGAALLGALRGASGATQVRNQIVWVTIGVIAVGAVAGAELWWLLIGRRAVGRAQRVLIESLPQHQDSNVVIAVRAPARVVAATAMTHYHRPTCLLVRGKNVSELTAADIARTDRRPCDVCGPNEAQT